MSEELRFTDNDRELFWELGFNTSREDGPFKYSDSLVSIYVAKHEAGFIAAIHDVDDAINVIKTGEDASVLVKEAMDEWQEKYNHAGEASVALQNVRTLIDQHEQMKLMQETQEMQEEQEAQGGDGVIDEPEMMEPPPENPDEVPV